MKSNRHLLGCISTLYCSLFLVMPVNSHAAVEQELAQMRALLHSMSERLDRLELENRGLTNTNAALIKASQTPPANITPISELRIEQDTESINNPATIDWTDKISWKGDFRYRYESFDIDDTPNRNRNRVRARAALIADVTESVEIGLGLASGGDDPGSSNQTLGDGNSTKELRLDLAYFDWTGLANTHVLGGKFSNILYKSGKNSMLWDGDWRPEGTGIKWGNGKLFAQAVGTWIESDNKKDQSFAQAIQGGVKLPLGDSVMITAGMGYYVFDTRGSGSFFGDVDDFFGNSFDPLTNTYLHDYEELEIFVDLGIDLNGRPLTLFADFVQNQAVDDDDTGYAFGFSYGKASDSKEWEFGYVYQNLEADAVLGLLTDSDFGGGGTDSKGHIIKGSYAIVKNWNANLAYFINDVGLKSGEETGFKRLQLDLSFEY